MLPAFDWPLIVECLRRQVEFMEILNDGAGITVNGIPWREAFAKINDIVGDPIDPRMLAA